MDHDYELAGYDRTTAHIHDKARLSKPLSYWQEIAPKRAAAEEIGRQLAEAAKTRKKGPDEEPAPGMADEVARQLPYRGAQY